MQGKIINRFQSEAKRSPGADQKQANVQRDTIDDRVEEFFRSAEDETGYSAAGHQNAPMFLRNAIQTLQEGVGGNEIIESLMNGRRGSNVPRNEYQNVMEGFMNGIGRQRIELRQRGARPGYWSRVMQYWRTVY